MGFWPAEKMSHSSSKNSSTDKNNTHHGKNSNNVECGIIKVSTQAPGHEAL